MNQILSNNPIIPYITGRGEEFTSIISKTNPEGNPILIFKDIVVAVVKYLIRILNLRTHLQAREYHHRFRKMSAVTLIIITATLGLGVVTLYPAQNLSHYYLIFFEDI